MKRVAVLVCLACLSAGVGPVKADEPREATADPGAVAAVPTAPAPKGPKRAAAAPAGQPKLVDKLELDRTQITGNSELPKVMVIVPWKRADIGDLAGQPLNTLVDEALQPVDRETFRREIGYFKELNNPGTPAPGVRDPAGASRSPEN